MKTRRVFLASGIFFACIAIFFLVVPSAKYVVYRHLPVEVRRQISFSLSEKFLIGMIYFVEQDGELLLVKHNYQERWGLPGGWLSKDETPMQCARRELKEELGASVVAVELFELRKPANSNVVDIAVVCKINSEDFHVDNSEISEFKFFPGDSLPEEILYTHKPYIDRYLKTRNGQPAQQIN